MKISGREYKQLLLNRAGISSQREKELQKQCEDYLNLKDILFTHLKKYVLCLKCNRWHPVGKDKGYPDLSILIGDEKIIFVELKVGDNKLSYEQKKYRDRLVSKGYKYFVIKDFESFMKLF